MILDTDLAAIYEVPAKRLNEQVQRNRRHFPDDFVFPLTLQETETVRSQMATLAQIKNVRSQFATSRWGGRRYRPLKIANRIVYSLNGIFNQSTPYGYTVVTAPNGHVPRTTRLVRIEK